MGTETSQPLRLRHSGLSPSFREDFCPGPAEKSHTAKLLRTDPNPGSFRSEGGAALGKSGELGVPSPDAEPRAAPSRQPQPRRRLPSPFSSPSQRGHEPGFTPAREGGSCPVNSLRAGLPLVLALTDVGSVSDHKEQVKPMNLKPQGQTYRQKENPVIFFHVFVVTGETGLLLSNLETLLLFAFPRMSSGARSDSRGKPGPGASANQRSFRKLSAPRLPAVRPGSRILTSTNPSGASS